MQDPVCEGWLLLPNLRFHDSRFHEQLLLHNSRFLVIGINTGGNGDQYLCLVDSAAETPMLGHDGVDVFDLVESDVVVEPRAAQADALPTSADPCIIEVLDLKLSRFQNVLVCPC